MGISLAEENAILRERIRELESALGCGFIAPRAFNLTRSEQIVLGVLMSRPTASRDALMAALYGDWGIDEPDEQIASVFIHTLRRKLAKHRIEVFCRQGQGWWLDAPTKTFIRAMIERVAA